MRSESPTPIHNKIEKSRGFRQNLLIALSTKGAPSPNIFFESGWPKGRRRGASVFKQSYLGLPLRTVIVAGKGGELIKSCLFIQNLVLRGNKIEI